mmetsp:Transcript_8418/g.21556  ORF Transcript_8418/g.21556 Transcript_8418/m.21556 type:complete len:241 (-) Transcript_8418:329-1051(-)
MSQANQPPARKAAGQVGQPRHLQASLHHVVDALFPRRVQMLERRVAEKYPWQPQDTGPESSERSTDNGRHCDRRDDERLEWPLPHPHQGCRRGALQRRHGPRCPRPEPRPKGPPQVSMARPQHQVGVFPHLSCIVGCLAAMARCCTAAAGRINRLLKILDDDGLSGLAVDGVLQLQRGTLCDFKCHSRNHEANVRELLDLLPGDVSEGRTHVGQQRFDHLHEFLEFHLRERRAHALFRCP